MAYRSRLLDGLLDELMADLPAVLLVGPRAAGKTTTAPRPGSAGLKGYVAQIITRDPAGTIGAPDPLRLSRYLEA